MIDLFIAGIPQPKGSTRVFIVAGHANTTSANPHLKGWEQTIRNVLGVEQVAMIRGPVTIELGFNLPQPQSRKPKPKSKDPLKRHPVPATMPDLDKLCRGALDALNKVAIEDDSRIVGLNAWKRYDLPVGVRIVIQPYPTLDCMDRMKEEP